MKPRGSGGVPQSTVGMLRAAVRPFCVVYSTIILGVLAIMATSGCPLPASGAGEVIVNVFIGITATITTEYAAERGARHYLGRKDRKNKEKWDKWGK